MSLNIDIHSVERLKALTQAAHRVVLVCHVAPDGDALGSTLGLRHVLNAMGKRADVITPDLPPESLVFMPGCREVIPASKYSEKALVHINAADLIVCLDFNALHRIDRLAPLIEKAHAPKVMIDHHLGPENWPDVVISHPEASSTCLLLYRVIQLARWEKWMSRESAECIYTGMMTDTGNFSYNSNDPEIYTTIAQLLGYGIDKDRIYKLAFDTSTVGRLRLNGYALAERMTVYPEHRAAIIALSREELDRFDYVKGDTEGLVNKPLSVPEISWCCFMREDPDYIKLSFRSKGNFPVNKVCEEHFGGGGHLNAAGGELHCSLQEAIDKLVEVMPLYDKYL